MILGSESIKEVVFNDKMAKTSHRTISHSNNTQVTPLVQNIFFKKIWMCFQNQSNKIVFHVFQKNKYKKMYVKFVKITFKKFEVTWSA